MVMFFVYAIVLMFATMLMYILASVNIWLVLVVIGIATVTFIYLDFLERKANIVKMDRDIEAIRQKYRESTRESSLVKDRSAGGDPGGGR